MKIVNIADTHGFAHRGLIIPKCDVLIFSGDLGGRTNLFELAEFLNWFDKQRADKKIFIGGNHDIVLDPDWVRRQKQMGAIEGMLAEQNHNDAMYMIKAFKKITYLKNTSCIYKGVMFHGSPYSPSFSRNNWVFNADRGNEISQHWATISNRVDVLITHTPAHKIFDRIPEEFMRPGDDINIGCSDLAQVIETRLPKLKLHCCGHIHNQTGVQLITVGSRNILFSNGAVVNNDYKQVVIHPLIITI